MSNNDILQKPIEEMNDSEKTKVILYLLAVLDKTERNRLADVEAFLSIIDRLKTELKKM